MNPTWIQVMTVFDALNGDTTSTLFLKKDEDELMGIIGGGEDGWYSCNVWNEEHGAEYVLSRTGKSSVRTIMIMGGSWCEKQERSQVD